MRTPPPPPRCAEGVTNLIGRFGACPGFFFLNRPTCALCAISCILGPVSPFILSSFYRPSSLAEVDLQVMVTQAEGGGWGIQ